MKRFNCVKNIVTEETMVLLEALMKQTQVQSMAQAMFSGEKINLTEKRAVLHVALRNRASTPIIYHKCRLELGNPRKSSEELPIKVF